jgi:hypothetical protein
MRTLLGFTVMYDFINLSRNIVATPFPSAISQFSARVSTRATVNTHETARPAFKLQRFAHDEG